MSSFSGMKLLGALYVTTARLRSSWTDITGGVFCNQASMSTNPAKSHAMVWLGAMAGVLLIYFICVPWVAAYASTHGFVNNVFVERFEDPWYYLRDHSFLHDPMDRYHRWCFLESGIFID